MHYYKRHLGDYAKKAGHLSPLEHGVYTLIIDSYYDREQAPTLIEATRWARARTEEEKQAVIDVLSEFFTIENDRYFQKRIEEELSEYREKAETNRKIAVKREEQKRARKYNDTSTTRTPEEHDSCTTGQPNHKPLTINHKPIDIEANASVNSGEKPPEIDLLGDKQENQLRCPIGHIVDAYHAAMPLNPQVRVLNDARKKMIAARWREAAKMKVGPFGYDNVRDGLEAWRQYFEICNNSLFLTGRAKAQQGRPPFVADIDFLMSPSGFASALENKYHREIA